MIEDIRKDTIERWHDQLEIDCSSRFANHEVALVELPNSLNEYDNNLLVIRRLN